MPLSGHTKTPGNRVLVINLWEITCECTICNKETSDKFGIPIYEDEIMPDDYQGEWCGSPVCRRCFYVTRGWQSEHPGKKITTNAIRKIIGAG